MKTSYQSYNLCRRHERLSLFVVLLALLLGASPLALAGTASGALATAQPGSILEGPPPGPCAGANAGAEYRGGADAYGHYVAPADLPGTAAIRLDSETVYADVGTGRHGGTANVAVDVKGLAAGLAAPTACVPHRVRH